MEHLAVTRNKLNPLLQRNGDGPCPPGLDWSRPWHEILHQWNLRVRQISESFHMQSWSRKCLQQHWNFARYIGCLPANRWVRRALSCSFHGARRCGRPRHTWSSALETFARMRGWDDWLAFVQQAHDGFDEFAAFVQQSDGVVHV